MESTQVKTLYVGFDGGKVVASQETQHQINEVEKLECALEAEGQQLNWKAFNNPDESRTIFQFILGDRRTRVDDNTMMADRPPIAVITVLDSKAVRLEFYEGHDALALSLDMRSKELQGRALPLWMTEDPQAYNPVKFLKEAFGFPEEFTRPIIEEAHKEG